MSAGTETELAEWRMTVEANESVHTSSFAAYSARSAETSDTDAEEDRATTVAGLGSAEDSESMLLSVAAISDKGEKKVVLPS